MVTCSLNVRGINTRSTRKYDGSAVLLSTTELGSLTVQLIGSVSPPPYVSLLRLLAALPHECQQFKFSQLA
jgi:hypothetical protein